MSGCRPEAVEAYALGELSAEEAAEVEAHLAGCRACAEELAWVRREQALFAARASELPEPPPFESILMRVLDEGHEACAEEAAPARAAAPAVDHAAAPAPARRRAAGPSGRRGSRAHARSAPSPLKRWLPRAAAAVALALGAALLGLPRDAATPLAPEPHAAAPSIAPSAPPAPPEIVVEEEHGAACGEVCDDTPGGRDADVDPSEHPGGDGSSAGPACDDEMACADMSCVTPEPSRPQGE
ncbi:zf-HC2 domain-containing protein [Sorangium sp. So ce1000]|uniref:zf-HC2 domain-containing protein n=1 Tax=Sorangium sp. So ce1000 TaxID=3133325 RepID=UPI003F639090